MSGNSDEGISSIEDDYNDVYEVERIIAQKEEDGQILYLVKWANYPDDQCTWEKEWSFNDSATLKLWRQARIRGDILDPNEQKEIEAKMERLSADESVGSSEAEPEFEEDVIVTHAPKRLKLTRSDSEDPLQRLTATQEANCEKASAFTAGKRLTIPKIIPATETKSPILTQNQNPTLTTKPPAASVRQNFYGIDLPRLTVTPSTRRLSNTQGRAGTRFKTLSHQNNIQKLRKQEPPPTSLHSLRSPSELVPSAYQDVAVNLPTGKSKTQLPPINTGRHLTEAAATSCELLGSLPIQRNAPDRAQAETDLPVSPNYQTHTAQLYQPESSNKPAKKSFWRNGVKLAYNLGDLVVRLHFGGETIGDSRLMGLASHQKANLLRFKTGNVLDITFRSESVQTLEKYSVFSERPSNSPHSLGTIEAYAHTAPQMTELSTYLSASNVAGVWSEDNANFVLILYTNSHEFVQKGWPRASFGTLKVVACRNRPWSALILPAAELPLPEPPKSRINSVSVEEHTQDLTLPSNLGDANVPFEVKYRMSYNELAKVPSSVGKLDKSKARFFLLFPEGKVTEVRVLEQWLTSRTKSFLVLSSQGEHSWNTFRELTVQPHEIGVILIYDEYTNAALQLMPGLHKRLPRENLQVFNVSLGRPLHALADQHFLRLFPSGLALMITEGCLVSSPEETSLILGWFVRTAKSKFGTYRLIMRPQVVRFLLAHVGQLGNRNAEPEQKPFLEMLSHLRSLRTIFESSASTFDDEPDHDKFCEYLSPMGLPVYLKGQNEASNITDDARIVAGRDARLVEYFQIWSLRQLCNFRKFVGLVLDDIPRSYHHIEITSLKSFIDLYTVVPGKTRERTSVRNSTTPKASPSLERSPV